VRVLIQRTLLRAIQDSGFCLGVSAEVMQRSPARERMKVSPRLEHRPLRPRVASRFQEVRYIVAKTFLRLISMVAVLIAGRQNQL
jgi:hypothetical protein